MTGLHSARRDEAERLAAPAAAADREDGLARLPDRPVEGSLRELAFRESDGIEVTLLWDAVADRVVLSVRDIGADASFVCGVERANALDAFQHPFAYVARGHAVTLPPRRLSPRAGTSS